MSLHFLVEHDCHWKIPTRIAVYDDPDAAEERLYRLNIEHPDEIKAGRPVRMEYVVLSADSLETVKRTHSRYFCGEYEVVKPTEIHYLSTWQERRQWTPEQAEGARFRAFIRALVTQPLSRTARDVNHWGRAFVDSLRPRNAG